MRRAVVAALVAAVTFMAGVTAPNAHASSNGSLGDPATIWSEDFNSLSLPEWFTHDGPEGWSVETSDVRTGEKRWRGWTFTTIREWAWAAGTDERHWFTRASGNLAVMESEHQRLARGERFTTSLVSPDISVAGESKLVLAFDSHYRQGASGQHATVEVDFGSSRTTLLDLTEDSYSDHLELEFEVPEGATTARLRFSYLDSSNDKWWAIDNVALHRPYVYAESAPTIVDVISDVHFIGGDPVPSARWTRAIDQYNAMAEPGSALVVNGDIVDTMHDANYEAARETTGEHPYANGETIWAAGNHEFYGQELSYEKGRDNFLAFAGRDTPYTETVVDGVPILVLGTEYYDDFASQGKEPFWNASEEQVQWLKSRLDYWGDRPVLLFTHYTLPNTVSGTHSAWYQNDYNDIEELNEALAGHTNVAIFTGHTHDWLGLNDWWGRYTMPENVGAGIPVFNTGALKNAIVPDGDNDEEVLPGDHSTGLRVRVYGDHLTVESWDFVSKSMMNSVTLPIGSGEQQPTPEPTTPTPEPTFTPDQPGESVSATPGTISVPQRPTASHKPTSLPATGAREIGILACMLTVVSALGVAYRRHG